MCSSFRCNNSKCYKDYFHVDKESTGPLLKEGIIAAEEGGIKCGGQLISIAVINLRNNSLVQLIGRIEVLYDVCNLLGIMPDTQIGYSFLLAWLRAGTARQGAQVHTDTQNGWHRQVCQGQPRRKSSLLCLHA